MGESPMSAVQKGVLYSLYFPIISVFNFLFLSHLQVCLFFSLTHTSPSLSSYSPSIFHRCIPKSASKLYLAGRKGLVLHGDSAVGSEHGDAQLLLSVQGLLVPLLHRHRLKGRDHCHLGLGR